MSKSFPPKIGVSSLPTEHFAQSGTVPSGTALRRVAHAYNQASVHRRRVLFARSASTQSTPTMGSTSEAPYRFIFRTGENVEKIAMLVGMAPASATSGTNPAACKLLINNGTSYDTGDLYYPRVQSGTYTPADVAWNWGSITTGVVADSVYSASILQTYYARIHSVLVYEIAKPIATSSVVGVADPSNWESDGPIYDAAVQDLCETGTKLWQHNGSNLLSWSRDKESTAPTTTSTTYVNLLETSSTTVTASTPGIILNTQYHDSQKGDVPVEIGVLATRTAGTGTCSVKFVDGAGTVIEETGVTSGARYTAAGTITAKAATKTDIHVKVNTGGATWRFDAIGLWEYEA